MATEPTITHMLGAELVDGRLPIVCGAPDRIVVDGRVILTQAAAPTAAPLRVTCVDCLETLPEADLLANLRQAIGSDREPVRAAIGLALARIEPDRYTVDIPMLRDLPDGTTEFAGSLPVVVSTGRPVVDVTDRLTPGARALVRERTASILEHADRVLADAAAQRKAERLVDPLVLANLRDAAVVESDAARWERTLVDGFRDTFVKAQDDALRRAFDAGRAYERGARARALVGKSLDHRTERALAEARHYLEDGEPTLAALVLAGFHALAPEAVAS